MTCSRDGYVLCLFDAAEALEREVDLPGLDRETLRRILGAAPGDPLVDCFEVDGARLAALAPFLAEPVGPLTHGRTAFVEGRRLEA